MKAIFRIILVILPITLYGDKTNQPPFVIAQIYGQLGNNLFQVAAASALAWDHGSEPCFPDLLTKPKLLSHVFFRFKTTPSSKRPISFQWNEPGCPYHPIPFQPNMKMIGYFQSEKYFAHHRNRILECFAPHPMDKLYMQQKYKWLIEHPSTVGVQLRYYKWEFPTEKTFPQYGKEYLDAAMKLFPPDSLFVVSSNNIPFARKSIPSWAKNVVFLENEQNYIDLYLLSLCKHNIITNSSFGWWGAWLNQNPNKIVVRPEVWINGLNTKDICPEKWISIRAHFD